MSLDLSKHVTNLEFKVTDNPATNQTAIALQGKAGGRFAQDVLVVFEKDSLGMRALYKALGDYYGEQ